MISTFICSTGDFVGRANGYDYSLVPKYFHEIEADGFEFMMLPAFYDKLPTIAKAFEKADVPVRSIHFEKAVTEFLGLHGEEETKEGFRLFTVNADMGKALGATKAVHHLWDGRFSPTQVEKVISHLDTLYEICEKRGLELMVETVPCKKPLPYPIVCEIAKKYPNAGFTYDVRHMDFMGQTEIFYRSPLWEDRIHHLHVSDYSGQTVPGMWGVTRPILHPGEGVIDFQAFFEATGRCHADTLTLESPVYSENGKVDTAKLNSTFAYLRKSVKKA